jgi:hypothetical protein
VTTTAALEADEQGRLAPTRSWASPGLLVVGGLFVLGAVARLWGIRTAHELFIDEVTYATIALNVATGEGVILYGESFHLHPPAVFAVLAAAIALLGLEGAELTEVLYALRPVPALFGALTPPLVALLVHRVTRSWAAAAIAGALLVLDPFLIRFDGRVLLEAQAMALAVGGILVVAGLPDRELRGRPVTLPAVGAGLLLAGSLLTKETYAFVTVLPIAVLLATGWVVQRRTAATVLATSLLTYLGYLVGLIAAGELPTWIDQKTLGVQRLLGVVHITGFNQEGAPSFVERLLVNLERLAVTYGLIGIGVVVTAWLVVRLVRGRDIPGSDGPGATLVVVWAACAHAHLAYALTIGTLEEQMFYLLLVSAVPVVVVGVRAVLHPSAPLPALVERVPGSVIAGLVAAGTVVALVLNAVVWLQVQGESDASYPDFLAWADEVPIGSRIATTDESSQFLLDHVEVRRLETGSEVRRFDADYLVLFTELIDQGYSPVDDELLDLTARGELVFRSTSRTVGAIEAYDLSGVTDPEGLGR